MSTIDAIIELGYLTCSRRTESKKGTHAEVIVLMANLGMSQVIAVEESYGEDSGANSSCS